MSRTRLIKLQRCGLRYHLLGNTRWYDSDNPVVLDYELSSVDCDSMVDNDWPSIESCDLEESVSVASFELFDWDDHLDRNAAAAAAITDSVHHKTYN
jgi:hypothetical protein